MKARLAIAASAVAGVFGFAAIWGGNAAADPMIRLTPVKQSFFGLAIHRATSRTPWPTVPFGSWILWDNHLRWLDLEKDRGKWSFDEFDKVVALGQSHGVELVYVLGQTPTWASSRPADKQVYGPGAAAPPANLDDWREYIRRVAARYKGRIAAYEVWNEPKFADDGVCRGVVFYCGTPAELVALTKAARQVLREIDPVALVVSPAFTGGPRGVEMFERFLQAGGADSIDAVAFHFYAERPEEAATTTSLLRTAMKRHGVGKLPIWNTEQGYLVQTSAGTVAPDPGPGVFSRVFDPDAGAALLARAYIIGASVGLERMHWYAWDNGRMGLFDEGQGKINAMGVAFGVVVRWLQGSAVQCDEVRPRAAWRCTLHRDGRSANVSWTLDDNMPYNLPLDTWVETLDGNRGRLRAGSPLSAPDRPALVTDDGRPW